MSTEQEQTQESWEKSRAWKGLPLTIDEVVDRYLVHIADGPECANHLRAKGFEAWVAMWHRSHARLEAEGCMREWDSRDYTEHEMRAIYDGIILHASRGQSRD